MTNFKQTQIKSQVFLNIVPPDRCNIVEQQGTHSNLNTLVLVSGLDGKIIKF